MVKFIKHNYLCVAERFAYGYLVGCKIIYRGSNRGFRRAVTVVYLCCNSGTAHFIIKRSRECFRTDINGFHLTKHLSNLRNVKHIIHI